MRIRCLTPISDKIFSLLYSLPFLAIFVWHCLMLLLALYEALNFRFWQAVQVLSYNTNNPLTVFMFVFALLLFWLLPYLAIQSILGVTELKITHELLIFSYKFLRISDEVRISAEDIKHFNLFFCSDGEAGDAWVLEVVANQRRPGRAQPIPARVSAEWEAVDMATRINHETLGLYCHINRRSVEWLGRLLADFYRVNLRATSQPDNTVAGRQY
jgi:hypothetical protein